MRGNKSLFFWLVVILLAMPITMLNALSLLGVDISSIWVKAAAYVLFIAFFALCALRFSISAWVLRKDPEKRLSIMQERYKRGIYLKNPFQLNELSTLYYTIGDVDKALALVREASAALTLSKSNELSFGMGLLPSELYRLNEVTYLIDLNSLNEAEVLLNTFDDANYKNAGSQYNIHAARAKLAIEKTDIETARKHLTAARGLPLKVSAEVRANIKIHLLLIEAECDLMENSLDAADKINEVLSHCKWKPTLRRANELKRRISLNEQYSEPITRESE